MKKADEAARQGEKAGTAEKRPKEDQSLVSLSINFRANIFRKKDLPEKLSTERGRFEEGIWGMQELHVNDDDFVIAFGRTWEGVIEDTFEGLLDTKDEAERG